MLILNFNFYFLGKTLLNEKHPKLGLPKWLSDEDACANARDTGSIPGPGRSHMQQSS